MPIRRADAVRGEACVSRDPPRHSCRERQPKQPVLSKWDRTSVLHAASSLAAAALEKEARAIRSGAALAAECAAQTDGDGGEDVSAEDVADAKRGQSSHLFVPSALARSIPQGQARE